MSVPLSLPNRAWRAVDPVWLGLTDLSLPFLMAICVKCEISLGNPRSNFPTQNPHPPRKRSSPPHPRKRPLRLYKRVRLFFASCAILSSPSSTFSLISSIAHLIQSSRNTTRPHARAADTNHTSTRHKSARQDKKPKV